MGQVGLWLNIDCFIYQNVLVDIMSNILPGLGKMSSLIRKKNMVAAKRFSWKTQIRRDPRPPVAQLAPADSRHDFGI